MEWMTTYTPIFGRGLLMVYVIIIDFQKSGAFSQALTAVAVVHILYFYLLLIYNGYIYTLHRYFHLDRQTTSFNDFSIEAGILLRGNGVPHAMLVIHMLSCAVFQMLLFHSLLNSLIPTPTRSFLTAYLTLTHIQETHLSALSLVKDCLAVRLMASFSSARFRSSASSVVPVVSSDGQLQP